MAFDKIILSGQIKNILHTHILMFQIFGLQISCQFQSLNFMTPFYLADWENFSWCNH